MIGSESTPRHESVGHLVAVFGISGVGKTTLIKRFVESHSDWQHLSASGLLAGVSGQESHELRVADRSQVESNQSALADAIYRSRTTAPQSNWLLDAHSVIDNGSEWVIVPPQIIARIDPDGLIFVQDDPSEILKRRVGDPQRVRPLPSVGRVNEEQTVALQTCEMYSKRIRLPLHRIEAEDIEAFSEALIKTTTRTRSA